MSKQITHGFHLVKGKAFHEMEDYVVAKFKEVDANELDLFAIFDGHLSHKIPDYLCSHLFENILEENIAKSVVAKQLSVDHEPNMEKDEIENRGGFVSNFPGISFNYNT